MFAKIFRIHMSGKEVFRFGEFSLDIAERQLKHGVETLHLSPKALDVLNVLVREHGRLVTKQELLARVWPNVFVDQGILTVHVAALRKVLGHASSAEWIQTVPREGYRFVGDVRRTPGLSRSGGGIEPNCFARPPTSKPTPRGRWRHSGRSRWTATPRMHKRHSARCCSGVSGIGLPPSTA